MCDLRQLWFPVVVTTQRVGLCEHIRSLNACMYQYQPTGEIWSVVVARQSENGIDGRPRGPVSPSTGHAAAPIFRMRVCCVHAVNIRAKGCTSRRPVPVYSGPLSQTCPRYTHRSHSTRRAPTRHSPWRQGSGNRSHYEHVPKPAPK